MGLGIVEFVMEVEKEFKVAIPDREAEGFQTVGELHAWIAAEVASQETGLKLSESDVWKKLQAIVAEQFAMRLERVTKETRFSDLE